ncbi:hypothetical protein SDC9_83766 [bioreactor metagenome]|uniref:Uncharacterized protein n=1 Tax=bioreactor metagenome TaxID=1076179 RepID=A0A644Z8E2_9ZZZZ
MGSGFVDGGADGVYQQHGHLAPGDALLGLEGSVAVAAENPLCHGAADQPTAVIGELAAVGKVDAGAGLVVQHKIAAQKNGRLLPGDGALGRGGGFAGAVKITGGVADIDIVVIPVGGLHVPKRNGGAYVVVAEGSVDQHHKFRAGQRPVGVEVAGGVPPHHAPVYQLFKIGLHPARGGGGDRQTGQQGQSHRQAKHGRQQPRSPAALSDSVQFHSEASFLYLGLYL